MKKLFSFFAAMLVAVAVNATAVILPATLDVTNVSFRSEGMPDFVLEDGDYAGTYFDMGAHDSANDTLLYAAWDVTIEPIKYNVAVDVYNTNSWRVQLYVLNQAGDTVKDLRYKGSSGQKGNFAIGSIDMRDLAAGDYKVIARAATAWSAMKLKDVIFEGDYQGVSVALPGTLQPAYAELSANASISNKAIAFKPSTAPDEYANWNVSFAEAGTYNVTIDITASNGHNYGVELIGEDEETLIGAVNEGGQKGDTGVKELGAIEVPAAGNYIVHLTNAIQWSEAVLNSITFAAPAPAEPQTLYLKPGVWAADGAKFAVWDITNSKWTGFMTLAEKETDVYTTTVDANVKKVIFVRLNGALEEPKWSTTEEPNNSWNQTADLDLEEGKDLWTVTDWSAGAWSKYVYEEPAKFYITGNEALVGEKAWDGKAVKSTADSYIFENLAAGKYQMKVVDGEAWKGIGDMTDVAGGLYKDQDGNICFILTEAGNVTVTYTAEAFTVAGNFAAPEVKLIGINGWVEAENAIVLTPAEDKKSTSVKMNLTGEWYDFKVIRATEWLGKENEGTENYKMHSGHNWVDGLVRDYEGLKSISLQPSKAGDYIFTYEYATGKLTVTFPADAPTGVDNADAAIKAVKMVQNGQLFIIKNDKTYNAQGQLVR